MAQLPPIRACIFDMDGLLLNTEDIYKQCADHVLARHGRPPLPWSVKAQLMGVPGSSTGDVFHAWAQLPSSVSRAQYAAEQAAEQKRLFPLCEPLPGAVALLETLTGKTITVTVDNTTKSNSSNDSSLEENRARGLVEVALASSTSSPNYALKTSQPKTKAFLDLIPPSRRVLTDDHRMKGARGKPAPDIFLVALQGINSTLPDGVVDEISPRECLVFEDSVPGVEAARRAGMRVVWVPHRDLKRHFAGREGEVLAGRAGLVPMGDEEGLGEVGDGWGEEIGSLEEFDFAKYGIVVPT